MSPTARSLTLLRRLGFIAAVVERRVPYQNITVDVFGFGDILAAHPRDRVVLLVQATSSANVAHRLAKARGRPELAAWLRAGGTFEVWGWSKRGQLWQVRRVAVRAGDLEPVTVEAPRRRGRRHDQRGLFEEAEGDGKDRGGAEGDTKDRGRREVT